MPPAAPRQGLREAISDASAAISFGEIAAGALRTLARTVDAHVAVLYRTDAAAAFDAWAAVGPDDLLAAYAPYAATDPILAVKARHNPELAVTTDLVNEGVYRRSAVYNEFAVRIDVEHQLVARLTPWAFTDPGTMALVLCRSRRRRRFASAELRAVQKAMPAFAAAARRAAVLEDTQAQLRTLEALVTSRCPSLVAVVALDGRLRWLSPLADRRLADSLRRPTDLPEPLARRLAQARALIDRAAEPRALDAGPLALRCGDEVLRLEVTVHEDPDGPPFLALHEPRAFEPSSHIAEARERYDLRKSEATILEALHRGLSNEQIARELYISPNTVRTHVQRILHKMRVDSRLQAVAVLRKLRR